MSAAGEREKQTLEQVSELSLSAAKMVASQSDQESMKEIRSVIALNVQEENDFKAKVAALEEVKEKLIKCPNLDFDSELISKIKDATAALGTTKEQLESHEAYKKFENIVKNSKR